MVTDNKYRWDFIGLSTDSKPTPATSDKVVDGSTFYCSDTSKLYIFCKDQWYEKEGAGGTTYTAGDNITISDGVISATDTTYNDFTGTDGTDAGAAGLVPAPAATDADKFLKSDGTWATAGGGSGPTVVQTTGTSTTDVMSQDATTSMVYADPSTKHIIQITSFPQTGIINDCIAIGNMGSGGTGVNANSSFAVAIGSYVSAKANSAISIGRNSNAGRPYSIAIGAGSSSSQSALVSGEYAIAIGSNSKPSGNGGIALGAFSASTANGEMNIGSTNTSYGYNSSNYRLLSGVYDGQSLHDAATVAQGNTLATAAPTTSTAGVLGQLYTDTTNMHTYQCTAIDTTDPDNPAYTWTQRW